MVRLFARHPAADYAAWRKHYDDFDEERQGMGVTGHASPDRHAGNDEGRTHHASRILSTAHRTLGGA